jgi:hypothetical protein
MEPIDRIAMKKFNRGKIETMALKANPEEMESESEHREVPKEDAIVKPVKGRKKRHKELTRGDCGSRRKLAAACRKVSRHAEVARRKRNVFRKTVDRERNWPQPAGR